ncbi:hypothetical protein [Bacillus salacetis]|nr:hypothetical protein [Bacillus salacetis]
MEKAFDRNGQLVLASKAFKHIGGYTCPCCGEEVFKAEGRVQSAHFRHKVGGKKEYCELYLQGLGSIYNPYDYATMVRKPYLTLEEYENDWDFYIKLPKIPKAFTRMFEDLGMYFNVYCRELQGRISSLHLRHDSYNNKIKATPKPSYHFSVDNKEYANKLQLQWPEKIKGFTKDFYLFTLLHGEFTMMERNILSLNDTFYIVAKKSFIFHRRLIVKRLKEKHGWYVYKIQMPSELDDTLIDWFHQKLGIELKRPFYYIDLLEPSIYKRFNYLYSIDDNKCSLALTFRDFQHAQPKIIHIYPDMTSREYPLESNTKDLFDLEHGFHTFYLKEHEGKILNIYVNNKVNHDEVINSENNLNLSDKQSKFIFIDKEIEINPPVEFKYNFPFEVWKKNSEQFPQIIREENKLNSNDLEIYSPGIWSFKVLSRRDHIDRELNGSEILSAYFNIEHKKTTVITNKQYNNLLQLVDRITGGNDKKRLKFFIRLYRNLVPLEVRELLENKYRGGE